MVLFMKMLFQNRLSYIQHLENTFNFVILFYDSLCIIDFIQFYCWASLFLKIDFITLMCPGIKSDVCRLIKRYNSSQNLM